MNKDRFLIYGTAADRVAMTVGETQTSVSFTTSPALTFTNPVTGNRFTLLTREGNDEINVLSTRQSAPEVNVLVVGSNKAYDSLLSITNSCSGHRSIENLCSCNPVKLKLTV